MKYSDDTVKSSKAQIAKVITSEGIYHIDLTKLEKRIKSLIGDKPDYSINTRRINDSATPNYLRKRDI